VHWRFYNDALLYMDLHFTYFTDCFCRVVNNDVDDDVVLCRTICDTDLDAVANFCPLMEQLDILGTREVSPSAVQRYVRVVVIAAYQLSLVSQSNVSISD